MRPSVLLCSWQSDNFDPSGQSTNYILDVSLPTDEEPRHWYVPLCLS